MEKTMVATGKTIDLAVESALNQLGLTRDDVSVEVLAQAKSGFLGIGASPAKVQVTYEAPDPVPEAPKSAFGSASRSKPKAVKKPEAPKTEAPKAPEAPKVEKKEDAPKVEKKQETPKAEKKAETKKAAEPRTYTPAAPGSVEEKIEQFLKGLLEHMNSQAIPHAWKEDENTYSVELVGEDNTDEKRLLFTCIVAAVQKVYLEKCPDAIAKEDN